MSHSANNASGTAASIASTNAMTIKRGSWASPSRHSRHMAWSGSGCGTSGVPAGTPDEPASAGRSSRTAAASGEDVIDGLLVVVVRSTVREPLRLQVEHRAVAAAAGHELIVAAEFDDRAMLDDADAVGLPYGREPV